MGLEETSKSNAAFNQASTASGPKTLSPDELEQRLLTTIVKLNKTAEFGNNDMPTGPLRGDGLKAAYKNLAPIVTGATANGELSNQDAKRFFEANNQLNPPKPAAAPAPAR